MHSHYKFQWTDPVSVGEQKVLAFKVTARNGAMWVAHFDVGENNVSVVDNPATGGGLVRTRLVFTQGSESSLPVKCRNHIQYKLERMFHKGIREMIRQYKESK